MFEPLIKENILDYIAMDIKTSFEEYSKVIKISNQESRIKKSIEIILDKFNSNLFLIESTMLFLIASSPILLEITE
jgi:hypothetical protein